MRRSIANSLSNKKSSISKTRRDHASRRYSSRRGTRVSRSSAFADLMQDRWRVQAVLWDDLESVDNDWLKMMTRAKEEVKLPLSSNASCDTS